MLYNKICFRFLNLSIVLIFSTSILSAQVVAPSILPSERLDGDFFNDNSSSYIGERRVTLTNIDGDDSGTLQSQINSLTSLGGGVIDIPAGTWHFGEIKLKSNVHLFIDDDVTIIPTLSSLKTKTIFMLGYNGALISNVSIRATSGQFTIDLSALDYDMWVLPIGLKEVDNFMVAGCYVSDKRTIHSSINCGVSKRNDVWAGPKNGLIKDITVTHAHDGYGAVQVRVGEKLHFKNIISLEGGATLRIETDAHDAFGGAPPSTITKTSEITGYNIKCKNGNAALMIQPWEVTNGWFDVEKIEAESCMATVRIDRAYVDIDAEEIGSFSENSRITNVTSIYGTEAHVKDGNFKSVPCQHRHLLSDTGLEGMDDRFFLGPTIAPVLYNASSTGADDPRYYKVNIPSENELAAQSSNFPENSLIVSRWSNTSWSCDGFVSTVPLQSLIVTPSVLAIGIDEKYQLIQEISPSNATNQGVSWVVADETIATVNQWGVVCGKSLGTTTIDVNSTDGNVVSTVTIRVKEDTSVRYVKNDEKALIYPNPYSSGELFVKFKSAFAVKEVSICDMQGRIVFNKKLNNHGSQLDHLELSELKLINGVYIVLLKSENEISTHKLYVK